MLNFNTQPYYDDFNENKNFHKILFKPGVAVQARELTQAQSILQDQIGKFGKFVLSDGSNVSGGKYTLNSNVKSLKLAKFGTTATDIEYYVNMYIVGSTSKVVGLISSVDVLNYYISVKSVINGDINFASEELLYIFETKEVAYAYLNGNQDIVTNKQFDYEAKLGSDVTFGPISGCSGTKNTFVFTIPTQGISIGDIITVQDDNISYVVTEIGYDGTFKVNTQLTKDYNNVSITSISHASSVVLEVSISEGVYFTNNVFVKALPQSIIPNLKTQYPSCCVGFEVVETIVDYVDDISLLDPSQGSYNYTAPGADRYKIYLNLVTKPLINGGIEQTALTDAKFIELLRIRNGIVTFDNTTPTLGALEDVLAAQMYDHAGNFIVTPFNISFSESNFSHHNKTLNATVSSGKAYVLGYPFNATFPTYIQIDKARETANSLNNITTTYYGNSIEITDVSGKLPIPKIGSRIELHSVSKNDTSKNTLLGYAYIGNINYTTTNQYTINLYNASISEQKLISANSIASDNFSANTVATAGINLVTDATYNKLLFKLPYANPSEIYDASITLDSFISTEVVSNVTTILTNSLTKQFACGISESLSTGEKNQNFIVVATSTNGAYTEGQYIDLSDVTIAVEQLSTSYKATLTFNNGYSGSIDVKYSLTYTEPTLKTKTLIENKVAGVICSTLPASIGYSDIVEFTGIFKSPIQTAKYVPGTDGSWDNSATYDKNDIVKYINSMYISIIDSNTGDIFDTTKWTILENQLTKYKTDNGQKEFFYDHGTISALSTQNVGLTFVMFNYFTHSTGEYIAFDSYPNTYKNIPSVKINNTLYNLRDYLDFRPRRKDSTIDTSKIVYDDYTIPSSIVDTKMYYDMKYYLGRIDKLILNAERKLEWKIGKSSYRNYIPPKDDPTGMTIATIQFDPYTTDTNAIKINYAKHRRYTMDDIGTLDTRLKNVEYYTALTLGEKSVLNTNIIDEYGTRLKNGFIVDAFTNYTIVDLTNNDLNICLDLDNNAARPSFITRDYNKLQPSYDDFGHDNGLKLFNEFKTFGSQGLVAYAAATEDIIVQTQATNYIKINQFDSISYKGTLTLNPQSCTWNELVNTVNIVNEDTKAIAEAKRNPGLLFNEWQTFYNTISDEIPDETNVTTVTDTTTRAMFDVSTATYKDSEKRVDLITPYVISKVKTTDVSFNAVGLAPLSKMYVYINNRLVSGYVTPSSNPTGLITRVDINNGGTGYTSPTATLPKPANTSPTTDATFALIVEGGTIRGAQISNPGYGYIYNQFSNAFDKTLLINGSNTSPAVLTTSTHPVKGMQLYTDASGSCSGILTIPNDQILNFDAGELVVTVCSRPDYNIGNSISSAQAIFYTKYAYYQNVITSIRKPYIKFVRYLPELPTITRNGSIIVPAEIPYTWKDDNQPYPALKSGSLSFKIYLNSDIPPKSDVTITYILNASGDFNGQILTGAPSSFTFTPTNYTIPQTLTVYYDLGTNQENKLPTNMEFYATSSPDDPTFNYSGIKPAQSWRVSQELPLDGVTSLKFVPKQYAVENTISTIDDTPTLIANDITINYEQGESSFVVAYSGSDIGLLTKSTTTYPLTFTAVSDSTNVKILSSEYQGGVDPQTGATRTINQYQDEYTRFFFNVLGSHQGLANVTVTMSSANNPKWTGKTAVSRIQVGPPIPVEEPKIIVHPNSETKPSTGTTDTSLRTTTSIGGTNIIGITLNKRPSNDVIVKANSSLIIGGGNVVQYSNNFTTYVTGNTVTFTPDDWNKLHSFIVSGYDDTLNTSIITQEYFIDLKSTSSNSSFNGLTQQVVVTNTDYTDIFGEPIVTLVGTNTTSGNGSSKLSVSVCLSRAPENDDVIRVTFESLNTSKGGIIITPSEYGANGIFQFTNSDWNTQKTIQILGATLNPLSGVVQNYKLKCTSEKWNTTTNKKIDSKWHHVIETPLKNVPHEWSTIVTTFVTTSKQYVADFLGTRPSKLSYVPSGGITSIPESGSLTENFKGTGSDSPGTAWAFSHCTGTSSYSATGSTVTYSESHSNYQGTLEFNSFCDVNDIKVNGRDDLLKVTGKTVTIGKLDGAAYSGSGVTFRNTANFSNIYWDPRLNDKDAWKVQEKVTITTKYSTYRSDTFQLLSEETEVEIYYNTIDDWTKDSWAIQIVASEIETTPEFKNAMRPLLRKDFWDNIAKKTQYLSDNGLDKQVGTNYRKLDLYENLKSASRFVDKTLQKIRNTTPAGGEIDPKLRNLYNQKLEECNKYIQAINKMEGFSAGNIAKSTWTPKPLMVNALEYVSSS